MNIFNKLNKKIFDDIRINIKGSSINVVQMDLFDEKFYVIVPAHNEEKNIKLVLKKLKKHFMAKNIIVIINGSTDKTYEKALSENVIVLNFDEKLGVGGAMIKGWDYLIKNTEFQYWLQFDADDQFPIDMIEILYQANINSDNDLIIGSRYLEKNDYEENIIRRVGNRFFSMLTNLFVKDTYISDASSGFRLGNEKIARFFHRNYISKYPDAPMIIRTSLAGFRIREIPVVMKSRLKGVSELDNPSKILFYPIIVMYIILKDLIVLRLRGKRKHK